MSKYYQINKTFDLKSVERIEKKAAITKKTFWEKKPLEKYLNIGYYLIIPIIIFLIIGNWLDKIFKTKPIFVLVFLFFGVLSSFYNLYRLVKEY
jgi:F0F1-type ATP synthase assembly protein I